MALAFSVFVLTPVPAESKTLDRGGTVLFQNYTVEPGHVVDGNLNVIFGSLVNEGTINGDVNLIGGSYNETAYGELNGKKNILGGDMLAGLAPWTVAGSPFFSFHEQQSKLFVKLASSIVVVVVFLLFPVRMRLALDRVERYPASAAVVGTLVFIAIVPVAILLLFSIVGIPLIAIEIAALFGAVWLGEGAIALLIGRRLYELVLPRTTPSPLAALVLGLVVVSAAEILPLIGWAFTAIVWVVGLGCASLAFVRQDFLANWGPVARGTAMHR